MSENLDVTMLITLPASIKLRHSLLKEDLENLEKTAENVHKHVALRARIGELEALIRLLRFNLTLEDVTGYSVRADVLKPSSPGLAEASEPGLPTVEGWTSWKPSYLQQVKRCFLPECEGNDGPVQLFHGVCYRCLHLNKFDGEYQEKGGYQVKSWDVWNINKWARRENYYVAIAGKRSSVGEWFGCGLPVMHMTLGGAVDLAVFEAEKQKNGGVA